MAEAVQGTAPGPGRAAAGREGALSPAEGRAPGTGIEPEDALTAIHATERLPHPAVMRLEQSVDRLDRTARTLEDTAYRLLDARGS